MRLINLDEFAASHQNGWAAVMRVLDKWEKEHPLTQVCIRDCDGWEITMTRKEK